MFANLVLDSKMALGLVITWAIIIVLVILTCVKKQSGRAKTPPLFLKSEESKQLYVEDTISFFKMLGELLKAGITIDRSLTEISKLLNGKNEYSKVVMAIKTDIEAGQKLNEALKKYPLIFNSITIILIASAEEESNENLSKTLLSQAEFLKSKHTSKG